MKKILDIAFKDMIRSLRSTFVVGMTVVAPLLLVGLIYFALGGASSGTPDLPNVKMGVVNADRLPADIPLDHPLGEDIHSMFFDENVAAWITASDYPDEVSARAAVENQEIGAALIIPQDFTGRLLAGQPNPLILITSDPTQTAASQVMLNMVATMLDGMVGRNIALQTVGESHQVAGRQPDPTQISTLLDHYATWYANFQQDMSHHPERAVLVMVAPPDKEVSQNPLQDALAPMMAGQMAFFAFFTGAYSMMSILRENEEGTLARLFTTPVGRTSILVGKFISVFLSVILQGVVLIAAAHYAFGIDWGEPSAVALALSGQVIVASGLGVLLISFVKTTQQAGPVLGGGLMVLGMLGGLFTSGMPVPEAFTRLAIFTPQGWVIKAWNIALSGQSLPDLMPAFAMMMVMGILMFAIGAKMFRKRYV